MSVTSAGYSRASRDSREGCPSAAPGDAPFSEVKRQFYADSRLLIGEVRATYAGYRQAYPPYGLVNPRAEALAALTGTTAQKWLQLERAMATTAVRAFNETIPKTQGCPYHGSLRNLGRFALEPVDGNEHGLDGLREVTAPGAKLAPVTIVNLLRPMRAMKKITGATSELESLARASRHSLLKEPLRHPQQYAKPFLYCLVEGNKGIDGTFRRENFMPDEVIADYIDLQHTTDGEERFGWSKSTLDFTLLSAVSVADRNRGSESDRSGDHITVYPAGTRLGDIQIDEPTIGCAGNQMAYEMWEQAVDVVVGERLWEASYS